MAKIPERRRNTRIPVDFTVAVTMGRKILKWRAKEFSEFGVLLASKDKVNEKQLVGQDFRLALELNPDQPAITVTGIVAYASTTGLGVRFKNVPAHDQAALRYYVDARGIGKSEKNS
ncbi:MAG: hypothetical protein A3F68_04750 [Acidobacteria bacterium RIFCSPLOWO2_12_FULL_54_10]|nr:MAG: hypothetical protein A3F68_04750 [Acidobacteria bacterium RIFCSPLOWO2_12_FULL_54_10]